MQPDSKRACQDLQFEILHAKSEKSGFSGFLDPVDPEIRKFLQISNGLAKTFNLRYYMPKSGPGSGSGSTGSGNPEIFADFERACQDL